MDQRRTFPSWLRSRQKKKAGGAEPKASNRRSPLLNNNIKVTSKKKAMPLDPATAAAITSTIDNASSIIATQNINKRTRKWNEEQYNKQRQHALMDWEMQNAYNSPQQQMERLKAAGLNPHLVYGNGAEAMSNQAPRSTDTQSWKPDVPQINTSSGLMAGYDIQQKQAQTDNIKELTKVAQQEQTLKMIQAWSQITNTKTAEFDLSQKQRLSDLVVSQAEANLQKTKADTEFTLDGNDRAAAQNAATLKQAAENILTSRLGRAKTRSEIDHIKQQIKNLQSDNELKKFDTNLKSLGIQPGDNMFLRILAQWLKSGNLPGKDSQMLKEKAEEGQPGYRPKPGHKDEY